MAEGGWIAVDLDRTLAVYDQFKGADHIGEPIMPMVQRVKEWVALGREVRVFTARANPKPYETREHHEAVIAAIQAWCVIHIGVSLQVTHEKDFDMVVLYDDRAVAVEPNTGRLLNAP
jgi:hypothetical protein